MRLAFFNRRSVDLSQRGVEPQGKSDSQGVAFWSVRVSNNDYVADKEICGREVGEGRHRYGSLLDLYQLTVCADSVQH